ncbi:MAG TPA: SrtB family sortase [Clostridiales bacterium]|nr:class B sortase [Clostridia bacterium]HCQ54977.1 SrtB family sortase [Clostridiales bacterium]
MKIIRIVIIICIIILLVSSYFLISNFLQYKVSNNSNLQLIEDVFTKNKTEENTEKTIIDWDKLSNINTDIIGWIKINDTNIDYPILKDTDNLKYLKHSFGGKYNNNGSIFTLNNNPFQDYETVLYGHNMKSGIMFSELGKYMNKEFFDKHSSFEIYTKNQNYKATVFSCYSIGINKEENNIKLLDFEEQVEYYKKASKYSVDNVSEIKKIVKLSTCSYLNNHTTPTDQRYYIVAKLEKVN